MTPGTMRWLGGLAVVLSLPVWLPMTCPIQRLLLTDETRALIAFKNRTHTPLPPDYDPRVTLVTLLEPGADESRWSPDRAGVIEGYLLRVVTAGVELANCLSFFDRDLHLEIGMKPDAPAIERVIVEVTPPMQAIMRDRGVDWSTRALEAFVGRRVRVAGWLMFDHEHADEAENTRPGERDNWRATAWELHPMIAIAAVD